MTVVFWMIIAMIALVIRAIRMKNTARDAGATIYITSAEASMNATLAVRLFLYKKNFCAPLSGSVFVFIKLQVWRMVLRIQKQAACKKPLVL